MCFQSPDFVVSLMTGYVSVYLYGKPREQKRNILNLSDVNKY